tara:strand:+ start:241 stop:537 length:297 start_codon:yes stop_codon:yes gene_type:complete
MDSLVVISLLSVAVVEEQDSLKVRVETLVLVVDLVTIIMGVFQVQHIQRRLVLKHKDMKVEPHIILIKEVVVAAALVVLVNMVDLLDMVMVDQELLLL